MRNILHDVFIVIGGVILFYCAQALLCFLIYTKLGVNIGWENTWNFAGALVFFSVMNFFLYHFCGRLVARFLSQLRLYTFFSILVFILIVFLTWNVSLIAVWPTLTFVMGLGAFILYFFCFAALTQSPYEIIKSLLPKKIKKEKTVAKKPSDDWWKNKIG